MGKRLHAAVPVQTSSDIVVDFGRKICNDVHMQILSKWLDTALTCAEKALGEPLFSALFILGVVAIIIWRQCVKQGANNKAVIKNSKLKYTNVDNSRHNEVSGENHGDIVLGDKNIYQHDDGTGKDANSITEEIADKYISKIHELARLVQDGDTLYNKFVCLVRGFKEADRELTYANAKEMILGGTWASVYGNIRQILNDVLSKLIDYKSMGVIFYENSEETAKAKKVSPKDVQNRIWAELSGMERMMVLLYGARAEKYTLKYQPGEASGRGFDFYELIGSTQWSRHFDVARLIYSVFAKYTGMCCTLHEILEEEHERCMQELEEKGRAK